MLLPRYHFDNLFNEFESLFKENCLKECHFQPGEYFVHPGDMILSVYYVESGLYKCSMIDENGTDCLMAYLGAGSLFPVKCRQYNFTIEVAFSMMAITEVKAYQLTPAILTDLIRTYPEIGIKAIHFHTLYSNMLSARLLMQHYGTSESKICNFLYLYYQHLPEHTHKLMLTQDEVAAATSLSRIQVARVYQYLKQQKIIETGRKCLFILDLEALKQLGSEMVIEEQS